MRPATDQPHAIRSRSRRNMPTAGEAGAIGTAAAVMLLQTGASCCAAGGKCCAPVAASSQAFMPQLSAGAADSCRALLQPTARLYRCFASWLRPRTPASCDASVPGCTTPRCEGVPAWEGARDGGGGSGGVCASCTRLLPVGVINYCS